MFFARKRSGSNVSLSVRKRSDSKRVLTARKRSGSGNTAPMQVS
ncbi:hypothetical protein [Lysinibacillus sp. TE18511]